jgi:antitoxin ParD1/3/4
LRPSSATKSKAAPCNNASEVVRAGLRLLDDTERQQAIQLQALKNDIAAGKASGAALDA